MTRTKRVYPTGQDHWWYKHGMYQSPEYKAWCQMIQRCLSKNRTITKRWLGENGFKNFIHDLGPKPSPDHSLNRIDPYKPFMPSNCRWSIERTSKDYKDTVPYEKAAKYEYNGQTLTLFEWSTMYDIGPKTIRTRLKRGWTIEQALTTKARHRSANKT